MRKYCAICFTMFCILACGTSCVYINEELGSNFVPTEQRYDIYTTDFPITEIGMKPVTELSGYSSERVTIGAIRDENGNVSTRSSAFSLIPALKYDFGTGGEVTRFHFAMAKDTLSFINESQKRILQDINIYALDEAIEDSDGYISTKPKYSRTIADAAIYDGGDSLSFDFRNEWAQEFLGKLQGMETSAYDSTGAFTRTVFPGICLTVDDPASTGGRINMFKLTTGADLDYYTITGGYASMRVKNATFGDRTVADTTFYFLYGARDFALFQEATDYYSGATITSQYALNLSSSTLDGKAQDVATTEIIVDGGGGLKPVISAKGLRDGMMRHLAEKGIDPAAVIINKATIVLPFQAASYEALDRYPAVLSPTCRISSTEGEKETITYAGITDTSVSTENQGEINRSSSLYSPDISYHMQQILGLDEYDGNDEDIVKSYREKDVWLLIMTVEAAEQEQEGMSQYAQNMYYNMYYNQLYNNYGYGYGYGYGGYGYGGYGYSNYYDYYTLAALYSMQNTQSTSETTTVLDRERYFYGVLNGPASGSAETQGNESPAAPYFKVTYSVRQTK